MMFRAAVLTLKVIRSNLERNVKRRECKHPVE